MKIENSTIYYNGNTKLKKAGVRQVMTVFEQQEFVKCKFDVIYFIKNYVQIISLDEGVVPFHLFPYQEKMIRHMENNRFSIFMTSRQMGKCVSPLSMVRLRNKLTGEVHDTTIGDFYSMQRTNGVADFDEEKIVEPNPYPCRSRTLHLGLAEVCDLWYSDTGAGK